MLSKLNQTPAAEIKPRINTRNAMPSRWWAGSKSWAPRKMKRIEEPIVFAMNRQIAPIPRAAPLAAADFLLDAFFLAAIMANLKALDIFDI